MDCYPEVIIPLLVVCVGGHAAVASRLATLARTKQIDTHSHQAIGRVFGVIIFLPLKPHLFPDHDFRGRPDLHRPREGPGERHARLLLSRRFHIPTKPAAQVPPKYKRQLLEKAVAAKQLDVVNVLLHAEPQYSLMQSQGIVAAVLEHPDQALLQALLDYEPRFAYISLDDSHIRCFIPEAWACPPLQISPVLHILLDNSAEPHDASFGPGTGALWAAYRGQQPLDIVGKVLARKGPVSRSCALAAIRHADAAVSRCVLDGKIKIDSGFRWRSCGRGQ
ncbi:hypothetical protein PG984_002847 [Apiospora sp. TS-2023a]